MITVINYGMGNLGSVANMLKKIGAECVLSSDRATIAAADKLILPGVGHFDEGMAALSRLDLINPILEAVLERKRPILGICLGMQLMGLRSEEGGRLPGLGLLPATTVRLEPNFGNQALKIPHMGWNTVTSTKPHPLTENLPEEPRFYFVHSYHVVCEAPEDVTLQAIYGQPITAGFARDHIMGVQFHPEKSHKFGMALLRNYASGKV